MHMHCRCAACPMSRSRWPEGKAGSCTSATGRNTPNACLQRLPAMPAWPALPVCRGRGSNGCCCALQSRASNKALGTPELEELFRQHCASLAQRMTLEVTEALQQHLGPLHKPEEQQQVHAALQHLEHADALLVDEARWVHASAAIKEAVWDAYVKHLLYGGPPVASALPANVGLAADDEPAGPSGREGRDWGGEEYGRPGRQQYDEYRRPAGRGYDGGGRGGYGAEGDHGRGGGRGRDRDDRGVREDDRRYPDKRADRYEQYEDRDRGRRRDDDAREVREGRVREERDGSSRHGSKKVEEEQQAAGRSRPEDDRSHKRSRR